MRKPTLHQRIKAKGRSQTLIIGITGYTAETWAQVKATATDPECFEDSFEKWKAVAIAARRKFQRSGVRAIEYQIIPQEFSAWCVQHGLANNSKSRGEYVSDRLTATSGQQP